LTTSHPNPPRLLLAPFKGLTNKAYRNAHARHFGETDAHMAPFVSGTGTRSVAPSKLLDLVPVTENLCLTIPQIISTSAEEIILFGKTMHAQGYDHINWNLGCPFPRIANKKRGCGLLPYPGEIESILDRVFREIPVDLSVKTRLGYHQPGEILKVLPIMDQFPLREITIHPRIGTQVYRGEVNLPGFAACLQATRHHVIYNGDLYNFSQYLKIKERLPSISSWMLGRGLLMDPFLALEIKGVLPSDDKKRELLRAFHMELLSCPFANEKKQLGFIKSVWYYMAGCFAPGEALFAAIKTSHSLAQYRERLPEVLEAPLAGEEQKEAYFRNAIKHVGRDPGDKIPPVLAM
jgi:tRNA-dihydrouridine synthase B